MARGNDGIPMQNWPMPRVAGQDRKHFPLGSSPAKPAKEYFAAAAGLASEKVLQDAVAGLSDRKEIETTLYGLLWSYPLVYDYMKWRMGLK